jgi:arsenite methyltransferase
VVTAGDPPYTDSVPEPRDCWADWLAERRFGSSDPEVRRQFMDKLVPVRDKVLDKAALKQGETLLDVGAGEGWIGFGAFGRGAGEVIFSDISADVLDICREAAEQLGVGNRCRYVEAAAHDLSGVEDESVDVVSTRSVLIYVAEKQRAFREFSRVLRPGGRVSLYEPINRFAVREESEPSFWLGARYSADGLADLAERLDAVYEALQPRSDPMVDFDERDLIRFAGEAGFFPIELDYYAEIRPAGPQPWGALLHSSGNPKIPTMNEAMEQVFTPAERERVTAHLRPLVEKGLGVWQMAHSYLWATRP